jgi:hypothetical protein
MNSCFSISLESINLDWKDITLRDVLSNSGILDLVVIIYIIII